MIYSLNRIKHSSKKRIRELFILIWKNIYDTLTGKKEHCKILTVYYYFLFKKEKMMEKYWGVDFHFTSLYTILNLIY